jgi:hypothetical protein
MEKIHGITHGKAMAAASVVVLLYAGMIVINILMMYLMSYRAF